MMKSKKFLKKWAKEIVRCEQILNSDTSSEKEIEQAQWKIEAIVNLYSVDMESAFMLMMMVEEIYFQEDLTD